MNFGTGIGQALKRDDFMLLPVVALYCFLILSALIPITWKAISYSIGEIGDSTTDTADIARKGLLFVKSIGVSMVTATLSAVAGFMLSVMLSRFNLKLRLLWIGLFLFPLLIPSHLYCLLWIHALGNEGLLGFLNVTFQGAVALVWILSLYFSPVPMLCGLIGMACIEKRVEESGYLFWSRKQTFQKITIPLLKPFIFLGWVIVFILCLNEYGVPLLLQVNLFTTEIFLQFSSLFKPMIAVIESSVVLAVVFIIVALAMRYFSSKRYITVYGAGGIIQPVPSGGYGWLIYAVLVLGAIVIVLLPLTSLLTGIRSVEVFRTTLLSALDQIKYSVVFSFLAGALGCVIGLMVAYYVKIRRGAGRHFIDATAYFIFAVPSMIMGIGLVLFWNMKGALGILYSSILMVVIGFLVKYLPLMIKSIESSMERHSRGFDEAAQVSGLSLVKRLYHVTIPLNLKGIAIGAVVLMVFSMNELNLPLLLVPPGKTTLSIRLFTLMHFAPERVLLSLGLCIIAINLALCAAVFGTYRLLRGKRPIA